MRANPAQTEDLVPALVLLSEALVAVRATEDPVVIPARDAVLMRLAVMEKQLEHERPGDRARAIRETLGLSKSSYYAMRTEARELGLISPGQSERLDWRCDVILTDESP